MSSSLPWIVTISELKAELQGEKRFLLDVREDEEWQEGHLKEAHHIPLGELSLRAKKEVPSKEAIVIYCGHGIRSLNALVALKKMGFEDVRSLDGGIAAWEEQGLPTVKD